jgi:hypothetical protein
MTLDFPLIPICNSGSLAEIGMGLASGGWRKLLHNTTRWDQRPKQPTIREWADWAKCLHIHNPFGVYEPMQLDQHNVSLRRAWKLPSDSPAPNTVDHVAKRLDLVEFVSAAKDFPHRLSVYVGSPLQLAPTARESQANWLMRFLRVLDPYISAGVKEIGFDNFMGSRPSYPAILKGWNGLPADAFKALESLGIEVSIEPFNYEIDEWLHKTTKWLTEDFLATMQATGWATRPVDQGLGIQSPGFYGERWVIIAKLWGTSQQKLDHLNQLKATNPTADIAAYALVLPVELLS